MGETGLFFNAMTTALTAAQQSAPTVQADEQQLHALKTSLDEAIAAADATLVMCRSMCGPELHGEMGRAFTTINIGAGHLRAVRDGLASLFRQRNVLRREISEREEVKQCATTPIVAASAPSMDSQTQDVQSTALSEPLVASEAPVRSEPEPGQPQGAPECRVGSSIHMSHRMGRDGQCAHGCGYVYPSLNLKP